MLAETREVQADDNSRSHDNPKDGNHEKDDEEVATPTTPPGLLKCSICQSTFRRPEHLRRHFRSHTKEKPFKCEHCGRCFSRTDTLHRHEVSHHAQGPDGERERVYRINVSTFRACLKCAVARVRCSGGTPCDRCRTKTLECEYPKERKSKNRAMREATQASTSAEEQQEADKTVEHTYEDQSFVNNVPVTSASPIPAIQTQHQFGGFETPSMSPIGAQPANYINQGVSQANTPTISPTVQHNIEPSALSPVRDQNYSNIGQQQLYTTPPTHTFPVPLHVRSNTSSERYGYANASPQSGLSTGMNMTLSNPTSNPIQMNFDPNLFDQSVSSAINWLPTNLFDGATDMGLYSGAPTPSLPEAWSADLNLRSSWFPPAANAGHIPPSRIPEDVLQDSRNLVSAQVRNNMGQYIRGFSESSSQAGSLSSAVSSGEYYIDGDGARLPKYKRRCKTWPKSSEEQISRLVHIQNERQNPSFGFPNIEHVPVRADEPQLRNEIYKPTYDNILDSFHQTCRRSDVSLFPKFDSEFFPSINVLTGFVRLYFDSFQSVYPIIHTPTFDPNRCHWILSLAVAAIGCHYGEHAESEKCARAMHEFLRRAIFVENEIASQSTPLWLIQATVLNCIGMIYSGDESLKQSALKNFSDLASPNKRERLFLQRRHSVAGTRQMNDWETWIEEETARRSGYFIWLLDCIFVYNFDNKPFMSLEDAQAPLPCREELWLADSEEGWRDIYSKHNDGLSLYSAIQLLYVEKRLVPDIGEFGDVLLLHAIYQRTWEVADYYRRPLSNWTPTASKEPRDAVVPNGSVWLPAIPVYSKWRNSACDCLDVLHWAANGKIAKASGLEPPAVLHLHAGRIVLLVPYKELRTMATSLARGTITWGEHESCAEWQYIWRWAKHDQHKARLSIIHAGALLWHVRRYSTNSFHEPVVIFLATLTLWAYGYCTRALKQQHSDTAEKRPEPDPSAPLPPDPTFVHLDRPCDDELVQLFVREGHTMQGNVTGVGDICGSNGPERVLKVGAGVLAGYMNWGLSSDLSIILTRLADQMSASPGSNQSNEL